MEEVYNFLDKLNINKSDNLVVAVSYGPDSMFLLNLLKNKYKENNIICAHVNHNHRIESIDEANKLEEYCKNNNIIFEFMKIEKYTNDNFTENEARNIRYKFFDDIIKKYNSKYLFTAHHGDDLIETILMKIVRGSNINGYSGIKEISTRNNYFIIRPLLSLTKDYILDYCNDNNIPYAVDKSNYDDLYTRNRYRNNILPQLKKENKDVHRKFLDFSRNLIEYDMYINNIAQEKYNICINNNEIIIDNIIKLDDLIIKRIIEKYLYNIYKNNIIKLSSINLNDIINLIKSNKSNLKLSLPNKINLIKSYNKIYLDNINCYNDYCFELKDKVILDDNSIIEITDKLDNTTNYFTAFLSSEIKFPLYVRNKKDGDKMEVLNMEGSKKIKDIFIDEKIPLEKRKNYPLLVDSCGKIIWIPGIKKSKYDRSKIGKYDIIIKYVKEVYNEAK